MYPAPSANSRTDEQSLEGMDPDYKIYFKKLLKDQKILKALRKDKSTHERTLSNLRDLYDSSSDEDKLHLAAEIGFTEKALRDCKNAIINKLQSNPQLDE